MKILAKFLVEKRLILFTISIALAILFSFFIGSVNINKDDTKYLAADSNMAQGLKIMEKEFPTIELKDSFQIMFEGLTTTEKLEIEKELKEFYGVESITFDPESSEHNSKTYTMYIVQTKFVKDTDKVAAVMNEMTNAYKNQYYVETYFAGGQMMVLDVLIPLAVVLGLIVLFIMCRAYVEPFLIIISICISILINMCSNIIFEIVSEMTFSIAAVFQLVLSIDYSIMLIHRYKQEYDKLEIKNSSMAMQNAIAGSFTSIISSSMTTVVGLLVLLLMSFTIGADIGLVLSKGVLMSVICVFTVMPTLIVRFHDLLYKTDKEYLKAKKQGGAINV